LRFTPECRWKLSSCFLNWSWNFKAWNVYWSKGIRHLCTRSRILEESYLRMQKIKINVEYSKSSRSLCFFWERLDLRAFQNCVHWIERTWLWWNQTFSSLIRSFDFNRLSKYCLFKEWVACEIHGCYQK
jgi:hypothetical protein